jgi:hypothetical protein
MCWIVIKINTILIFTVLWLDVIKILILGLYDFFIVLMYSG